MPCNKPPEHVSPSPELMVPVSRVLKTHVTWVCDGLTGMIKKSCSSSIFWCFFGVFLCFFWGGAQNDGVGMGVTPIYVEVRLMVAIVS